MRRPLTGSAAVVGIVAASVAGCTPAGPDAVIAVGRDPNGYLSIVRTCHDGPTYTYLQVEKADSGDPVLAWIGRTVEPITYYRFASDPPDNWVLDLDGGLVSDVTYTVVASADDRQLVGPEFTIADLTDTPVGEVIDGDGRTRTVDDFLENACAD